MLDGQSNTSTTHEKERYIEWCDRYDMYNDVIWRERERERVKHMHIMGVQILKLLVIHGCSNTILQEESHSWGGVLLLCNVLKIESNIKLMRHLDHCLMALNRIKWDKIVVKIALINKLLTMLVQD